MPSPTLTQPKRLRNLSARRFRAHLRPRPFPPSATRPAHLRLPAKPNVKPALIRAQIGQKSVNRWERHFFVIQLLIFRQQPGRLRLDK